MSSFHILFKDFRGCLSSDYPICRFSGELRKCIKIRAKELFLPRFPLLDVQLATPSFQDKIENPCRFNKRCYIFK